MPRFQTPPTLDPALRREAQELVNSAYQSVSSWIDENVDNLLQKTSDELANLTRELETQVEDLRAEIMEDRRELDRKLDRFSPSDFEGLDTDQRRRVAALQDATMELRRWMDEREEKWCRVGARVAKVIESAARKVLAISV